MLRRVTMLAVMAGVLAMSTAPTGASAQWQEWNGGNPRPIQTDETVQVTATTVFHSQIGDIECQTVSSTQLLAGQTTANVTSFGIDVTAGEQATDNCLLTNGLLIIGCTDVASFTGALPWTAHATGSTSITVETDFIQVHMHGGIFCPKTFQITPGELVLTVGPELKWSTGTLAGGLTVDGGGYVKDFVITGEVHVTPSGTYGTWKMDHFDETHEAATHKAITHKLHTHRKHEGETEEQLKHKTNTERLN